MKLKRAYLALLRLYPEDFRTAFAPEMLCSFETAAEDFREEGRWPFVQFLLAELAGLIAGAASERIARLTPSIRWRPRFADASPGAPAVFSPDEIAKTEGHITFLIGRMVHAIANHDFPGARSYSLEERRAQERLRQLTGRI